MKKLFTQTIVLAFALTITASALGQSTSVIRPRRTAAETTQPAAESTKPAPENTKAAPESTRPAPESTKPAAESTKPAPENTKAAPENTKADTKTNPAAATDQPFASPSASPTPVAGDVTQTDTSQAADEAAIVQNYNNFFTTYKLGPEDIISVTVFGQERYSKQGIKIPPSGRISLTLIPDGIFVNGKTVDQVAELIKKRYDEFIIDPQVSVSLDQAGSYRYSVIGDVGQPGIRLMTRRLSVTEALAEAGGVLQTGDKKKVYVLRKQANGNLAPIPVNVAAIYRGQAPDSVYLIPGDQVVVPGNKWKTFDKITSFLPILSFARIFTGGF